ncbi:hypothetical protein JHT19_08890 [Vibrio parahaemolyticus]|uniref:Uncharacterized protein n=1 Tax=Vibrio parahaemolyticus TaxID=670 RepID=A0A8H9K3C3_VIBPH|nr:hypothetical protein [Vibrio parahaemolyticus]UJX07169.1 hypothetical protein JHT19_08890 [Vibrio parahaemolyticus]HAS6674335.1 hypothetical protein [Vibrio parahaemolyticus]HAS6680028.1 hypothetical protein [Vibrio parahaemolyticus]HAV1495062.1 hypothetical protein [Vibrio parahaemolyticus]
MSNAPIINAYGFSLFSERKLSTSLVDKAAILTEPKGNFVLVVTDLYGELNSIDVLCY